MVDTRHARPDTTSAAVQSVVRVMRSEDYAVLLVRSERNQPGTTV